jgi:hypothetical protein
MTNPKKNGSFPVFEILSLKLFETNKSIHAFGNSDISIHTDTAKTDFISKSN